MIDLPNATFEVEYKYSNGVPGRRGGFKTLRIHIHAPLTNEFARDALERALSSDLKGKFDDICIIGEVPKSGCLSPEETDERLREIVRALATALESREE